MKRLFLTILPLLLTLTLLFVRGQGIRAVADKKPEVGKTPVVSTPATYAGRQIMVASGGGFTGFSASYYLLDNGKLFGRRSRDTTFTFIGQQTTANTKRVFSVAEDKCKIRTTQFDHPGNIYKVVRWRKGNVGNKVAWGAPGRPAPPNYAKFYDSFMSMIPAASRLK